MKCWAGEGEKFVQVIVNFFSDDKKIRKRMNQSL